MRQVFFAAIAVFAAGSACASSIEVVGKDTRTNGGSISQESCPSCPALESVERKKDYVVPTLAPGSLQSSEIRDVDGEKKLYRTEGWMGGSPVVFVTKAPAEPMTASAPPADNIDRASTTAAVIGGDVKPIAANVVGAPKEQTAPLDVSTFELRL
ncbi:MAG: plant virulence effector HPE1-like domain-containing protein [Rhizobium sp.]|uniref:plant virulence effector HPE1-like domain-containing protein n=1 Tax=unclassified Rhizobium TaxID=2613769 RepID=UPI000647420B